MTTVSHLHSWTLHEPPVLTGPVADGLWTLERLARRDRTGILGPGLVGSHPRLESLLALHWAVMSAVEVVVAPFAYDGTEISAAPGAVGVVGDDRLGVAALWVGDVAVLPGEPDARRLGRCVGALLEPVLLGTCGPDRLDVVDAERLLLEALSDGVGRLERATRGLAVEGWADDLLLGVDDVRRRRSSSHRATSPSAA